jgi:hypothetical protein
MEVSMAKRGLLWVLAALLVSGNSWADEALLGKWKLDPSRSKMTDQMKVEAVGNNKFALNFSGDNVETIVADGTDQPGLFGTTFAITIEAPDTWKVVRKMQGRTTISAIWNLSADGSTLTDHFTGIRPDGSTNRLDYVYKRSGTGSGFSGTWESVSEQLNSKYEMQVQPYENDGLAFVYSPQQVTKNVKFDGKDYPAVGPNVPAGYVTSARRTNDETVELTDKINGKVSDTQQIELSPDHKTLTVTIHPAGRSQPNVLVYDRE